jgi:type I site-specific restriction endonuclease
LPGLSSEAIDFRAASESFAPFRALRRRRHEAISHLEHSHKRNRPRALIQMVTGSTIRCAITPGKHSGQMVVY